MRLGVFSRGFNRSSTELVFDAVIASGIKDIHFSLPVADTTMLADTIEEIGAKTIRTLCEEREINIASISGTFNAIHPDTQTRKREIGGCIRLIKMAADLGTTLISLSTGTRNPQNMWLWHPENNTGEAWKDLLKTLEILLAAATEYCIDLAIEPEPGNVIDSAAKARLLLDELDCPALKIIIDGANLIGDQPECRMAEIFDNTLELLASETVMAHAKEIPKAPDKTLAVPGEGKLDWKLFLGTLVRYGFEGPLIMHNLPENRVVHARVYLEEILKEVRSE